MADVASRFAINFTDVSLFSQSLFPAPTNTKKKTLIRASGGAPTSISISISSNRDQVYIATTPLKAPKGPPQFLISALNSSLRIFKLQHFMAIINPASSHDEEPLVYDFQPQDPEGIYTAIAALSGRKVPGVILERKINKVPNRNCWFVGYSKLDDAVKGVEEFNGEWDCDLRIGYHDCRNYVEGLVEYLTGEKINCVTKTDDKYSC